MSTYYIQNGFIGNAVAWWRKGGAGYGSDIRDAEVFSEVEARKIISERRDFQAWRCSYIESLEAPARKQIIDGQYLDAAFRL